MLNAGVAIQDHIHVVGERRTALRNHIYAQLTGGFKHLLTLIPSRLVVAFYSRGSERLCSANGRSCVLQAVDHGFLHIFSSIENASGGENAGAGHIPGSNHLRL